MSSLLLHGSITVSLALLTHIGALGGVMGVPLTHVYPPIESPSLCPPPSLQEFLNSVVPETVRATGLDPAPSL